MGNSRRTGLTLVESLFAISALAILFIQAVPAAQRARSDARLVLCQDRMGGIARASLIYAAQDPNELVIPIGMTDAVRPETIFSAYAFGGKSGTDAWYDPTLRTSRFSGTIDLDANQRPLNKILYKKDFPAPIDVIPGYGIFDWSRDGRLDLKEYHCPGDVEFSGMHHQGWKNRGSSSYNYYGTSYAANTLFATQVGCPAPFSIPLRPRAHPGAESPQDDPLFRECGAFRHVCAQYRRVRPDRLLLEFRALPDAVASAWWPADITGRTGRLSPVSWTGGLRSCGCRATVGSRGLRVCRRDALVQSVIAYLVRGVGWQRDTFPADSCVDHQDNGWRFIYRRGRTVDAGKENTYESLRIHPPRGASGGDTTPRIGLATTRNEGEDPLILDPSAP
jgi:hypothetical protein